ncbi:MAG TPA: hypothetical protein VGG11_22830 [Xanthobacteraceae bacterium]|jgi:hypothetical protein
MSKPALALATPPTTAPAARAPARQRLAAAHTAADAARARHGAANAAVAAVQALSADKARLERELESLLAGSKSELAAWATAGASGEAPLPDSAQVLELHGEIEKAVVRATAAAGALAQLQDEALQARADSRAAIDRIDQSVRAVLAEEANAIDAEIGKQFERITALRSELVGLGNHAQRTGAHTLINCISTYLDRFPPEPKETAIIASQARWRTLAERLATDPDATLARD